MNGQGGSRAVLPRGVRPRFKLPALPEAAARLAVLLPRERLDPAVLAWVRGASRRTTWSVAVSGGPDSVALLLLVWAHWPERRRQLRVLHFNHRLRGRESLADLNFCRRMCTGLGVRFVADSWPGSHRGASEAEARQARMDFFERRARAVWLGHQQDDVAESILMRLARGSGTGGLAAPRPVQDLKGGRVHLRPLLGLKKVEIVKALKSAGVAWREDATNRRRQFFRNRIRLDVMPTWGEAARRDVLAGAARSRLLLDEDDAALEGWLDGLQPLTRAGRLDVGRLSGKPRALIRRALHRWFLVQPLAGAISRQAFEILLSTLESGKPTRQSIGREGFAVFDGTTLRFEPAGKPLSIFQRRAN